MNSELQSSFFHTVIALTAGVWISFDSMQLCMNIR